MYLTILVHSINTRTCNLKSKIMSMMNNGHEIKIILVTDVLENYIMEMIHNAR